MKGSKTHLMVIVLMMAFVMFANAQEEEEVSFMLTPRQNDVSTDQKCIRSRSYSFIQSEEYRATTSDYVPKNTGEDVELKDQIAEFLEERYGLNGETNFDSILQKLADTEIADIGNGYYSQKTRYVSLTEDQLKPAILHLMKNYATDTVSYDQTIQLISDISKCTNPSNFLIREFPVKAWEEGVENPVVFGITQLVASKCKDQSYIELVVFGATFDTRLTEDYIDLDEVKNGPNFQKYLAGRRTIQAELPKYLYFGLMEYFGLI